MPELPDLEVFSVNLTKQLAGKVVKEIQVVNASKLNVEPAALKKAVEGHALEKVSRAGKELRFYFQGGNVLGLHLMLNGDLQLFKEVNTKKNTIFQLLFESGEGLAVTDFQGLVKPSLNPEKEAAPDALSEELTFDYLKKKLQSKKLVKVLLMEQKIIRGIGNAYADEILWEARISPFSISNKIPDDQIRTLLKAIKSVLNNAINHINKHHPDLITGEVRDFLNIHNARRKVSPTGAVIEKGKVNSRTTYYTIEQTMFD